MLESFEIDAVFVRQLSRQHRERLARKLVTVANSTAYFEPHRASALGGLLNIAAVLSRDGRSALLPLILEAPNASTANQPMGEVLASASHPLSRFRINLGEEESAVDRLTVAAALSTDRNSSEAVTELLLPFLYGKSARNIRLALRALMRIEISIRPSLDLNAQAHYPDPDVRSDVAAYLCQLPIAPVGLIERLATDANRKVRVAIALNLRRLSDRESALAGRLREQLLNDSSAHVRIAAAGLLNPPEPAEANAINAPDGHR
jgi:hypothetical protein